MKTLDTNGHVCKDLSSKTYNAIIFQSFNTMIVHCVCLCFKHSFTNSHYRNYLALKKEKNCNAFKVQAIMVILSEAVFIKIAWYCHRT